MRSYAEAELDGAAGAAAAGGRGAPRPALRPQAGADHAALIVEIRAGTGGDEAALFARDLYEMYRRFAEQMGWKFEMLDMVPTELGGFREVSFGVAARGRSATSSSRAAATASSACRRPRPRAGSTPRPPPSPSCPSPRRSTS